MPSKKSLTLQDNISGTDIGRLEVIHRYNNSSSITEEVTGVVTESGSKNITDFGSYSPNRICRDLLTTYLQVFPVEDRARCVDKLGWYEDSFITASQTIGHSSEKIVFKIGMRLSLPCLYRVPLKIGENQ